MAIAVERENIGSGDLDVDLQDHVIARTKHTR